MILATGDIGTQWILDLCSGIVKEGNIPEYCKSSVVLPIYKGKGDPMECGSYRGIKLLEHAMNVWIWVMVSLADIICGWWFWLGDGFLVLVMLTDQDNLYCSPVLLLWDVELFSNFHLVVNLGAFFSVTVLAGHCRIVACTLYCNGHLPDRWRQSVWKNQDSAVVIQWYDSNLHSYLTFLSECLNMSHGISGTYYLRVVILAWRCLSGVNYFDKINILCNILQHCYFRV